VLPQPPSWIQGEPTSKGRKNRRKGERERKSREKRKRRERVARLLGGWTPLLAY